MKTLTFFILLIGMSISGIAQEVSFSSKINEIYSMLPLECKNDLNTSSGNSIDCSVNGNSTEIKLLFDNEGQLTHIGMDLFSFNENLIFNPSVLSFIERLFLEYLLIDNIELVKRKMQEDQIGLKMNNSFFGNPLFNSLEDMLPVLQGGFDFIIEFDGNFYTCIFNKGADNLAVRFPANNNIITGLDKKEYGHQIADKLKDLHISDKIVYPAIDESSLVNYRYNIKVSVGDSYFKSITSSKYFNIDDDGKARLLFSEMFPLESFSNVFLVPFQGNKNINLSIEHKIYGEEKLNYSVPLSDFLMFFQKNFECYFGLESVSKDSLSGTLILFNRGLNFINLLYVNTSREELFKVNPRIEAKFYTGIPSDNIKNLFAEKDKGADK